MAKYIPQKADLINLSFDPNKGHEQKGHRPALVLSSSLFNQQTGLAIVCPITSTERGYPFHLTINSLKVHGFVMVDQVRTVDFMARKAKYIASASPSIVSDAIELLGEILEAN